MQQLSEKIRSCENERLTRFFKLMDVVMYFIIAACTLWFAHWSLRSYIGLAVAVAGFALWMTARMQLGASFSIGAEARGLVTAGLYSKFRHPVYLFGFVAYSGLFLIWGRWISYFAFILAYSFQLRRIRKENQVLEQAFGDEYRRYKARTWI